MQGQSPNSNDFLSTRPKDRLILDDALDCRLEIVSTFENLFSQEKQEHILNSLLLILQGTDEVEKTKALIIVNLIIPYLSSSQRRRISTMEKTPISFNVHTISLGNLIQKYEAYIKFKISSASVTQNHLNQALENDDKKAMVYAQMMVKQLILLCQTATLCYNQYPVQILVNRILKYLLSDSNVIIKLAEPFFNSLRVSNNKDTPEVLELCKKFKFCKDAVKCHHQHSGFILNSYCSNIDSIRRSQSERVLGQDTSRHSFIPRTSLQKLPPPSPHDFQQGNVKNGKYSLNYTQPFNTNK